jgi:hypothetical protein
LARTIQRNPRWQVEVSIRCGTGGIIGAIAGNAGMGAAIGAGTGLVGGYLYGKHKESEQAAYERGVDDGRQAR